MNFFYGAVFRHWLPLIRAIQLLVIIVVIGSCTQKMVCPAYQSAFIFDTTALKQKFSYFVNDTPKIYEVNKNKFLLIEPVPYRKQLASFRTIEMLPIYPVIPDSLRFDGDEEMEAEKDVQDSVQTVKEEPLHPGLIGPKFNVEQENYMYYFRRILVLPDVRAGLPNQEPVKKGFFSKVKDFFSKPFKKRKARKAAKAESDLAPAEEDSGEPKKGMFDRLKKDKQPEVDTDTGENEEGENQQTEENSNGNGNSENGNQPDFY